MDKYVLRKVGDNFEVKKNGNSYCTLIGQTNAEHFVKLLIGNTVSGPAVDIEDEIIDTRYDDRKLTIQWNPEAFEVKFVLI